MMYCVFLTIIVYVILFIVTYIVGRITFRVLNPGEVYTIENRKEYLKCSLFPPVVIIMLVVIIVELCTRRFGIKDDDWNTPAKW